MLLGAYTEVAARRIGWRRLSRGPVWLLNRTASGLDRRIVQLSAPQPGSLTANLHVVATVDR
jgi:hypothetical protein